MTIHGTGIDIVGVKRIADAINRWGDDFLDHVYCPEEIAYAGKHKFPEQHYAGRFAAKEAVLKAIGKNAGIVWKDIKVLNDENGQPYVEPNSKLGHNRIILSISHTKDYAVANAIITQESPGV